MVGFIMSGVRATGDGRCGAGHAAALTFQFDFTDCHGLDEEREKRELSRSAMSSLPYYVLLR